MLFEESPITSATRGSTGNGCKPRFRSFDVSGLVLLLALVWATGTAHAANMLIQINDPALNADGLGDRSFKQRFPHRRYVDF